MNFSQMQERLRVELLRRIQRGSLSVALLARQTGFKQSHLSNFLRSRRHLSLEGVDRILASQHMGAADLLPASAQPDWRMGTEIAQVPVVSHATAMHEPYIRPSATHSHLWVPAAVLGSVRSTPQMQRKAWQRFVAVTVPPGDALPMDPLVQPDSIALIDRHYDKLAPYRPNRPNLHAMRKDSRLKLRYADFLLNRIVLRPHNRAFPVELMELGPGESPGDRIVGRVILILNEH